MTNEEFKNQDQEFEKAFRPLREKKVPSEILDNFSGSVEQAILQKRIERENGQHWLRGWFPVMIPVLGALLLFVAVSFFKEPTPSDRPISISSVLPLALSVADLSAEIAALEELGVWNEEDDAAVDETLVGL